MIFYIAQLFIAVGYIIFFISRFKKDKKNILITDNISRICFVLGYSALQSINGVEHTIYGIARNIIGQKFAETKKEKKFILFIIMLFILCLMYGVTFNGISTVIFIISGLINLFAVIFFKEQGIRLGTILASVCNIIAFIIVGSYASMIGETLCGVIGSISFIKNINNIYIKK